MIDYTDAGESADNGGSGSAELDGYQRRLQCELPEGLGYSQQYYARRSAHLVEVETDAGLTGWGECFGPGNVALANRTTLRPLYTSPSPRDRPRTRKPSPACKTKTTPY